MFLIRIVSRWFFVKLFLVLAFTSIKSFENDANKDCPAEITNQLKWQQTQNSFCALSEPPCTNERMELSRRCCKDNGTWASAPRCVQSQRTISNPCPETAHSHNSICIFIVQNTTYPPACPYEETLPFSRYVDDLDPALLPVWMPVVRQMGIYGIGPFYWMEASPAYKLPYNNCKNAFCSYSFKGSLTEKSCLIYHNLTFVEAVSCTELHNVVCAYQILGSRGRSFCSQTHATPTVCKQSDYSTRSKCFCLGSGQTSSAERAEFLQPYQNLIYQSSTNEGCYIGLERQGNSYVWSNSNSTINYTNWAGDAVFGEEYVFGGISSEGWIMAKSEDELNCTLYQKETIKTSSEMVLTYDENSTLFTLTLNDPKSWVQNNGTNHPLIFCFTDASKEYVIRRIEVGRSFDESSGTFVFSPLTDGPGNYWCEGFPYPEVEMKKSNEYMLKVNTEEYIVILSTDYSHETSPLTEPSLTSLQQLLQDNIDNSSVSTDFYPRIFKVVDIEEESSRITLNFHFTTTIRTPQMSNYNTLRNIVNNLKDFRLENFLVADICLGVQVQSSQNRTPMTWPITRINDVAARPREGWCVNDQGAIVSRLCGGNFIDGAQWARFDGNCTIVNSTNITLNLTNIVNNKDPDRHIDEVVELTTNHENFSSLVIKLFSEFLGQVSTVSSPDMKSIVEIINNIANTPVGILRESQMVYQATDRILDSVDKLMKNSSFSGAILGSKFSIISCNFGLQACRLNIMTSPLSITFSNVTGVEDSNPTLSIILKQKSSEFNTNEDREIIATVYDNPSFFSEIFDEKNTSMVVSIHMPMLETSVDAYSVYTKDSVEDSTYCSNWKYEIGKIHGHWDHDCKAQLRNGELVCEFPYLGHFGLVSATNVSYELERIMSPLNSMKEKSSRLASLLEFYSSFFKAPDIYLVSEILSGFSKPQEEELDSIADVVDKIVDIDEAILTEAIMQHNLSTGRIISSFDRLVNEYKKSKAIARKNFFVLIHNFDVSDVYGFRVAVCENYCSIDIVNETDERADNIEVEVTFATSLLKQMMSSDPDDSLIVVTVFSKNVLFAMGNSFPRNISSKVIGVRYPRVTLNSPGDIEIRYRFDDKGVNHTCERWRKSDWEYRHKTSMVDDGWLQCHVEKSGYTALLSDTVNTTHLMEDIHNSNISMKIRLQKIERVLQNFHRKFRITDIPLIAKIFAGVTEVDPDVLQLCVNIINIAMNIDREVLRQSQNHFGATDQILFYLEEIAGRFKFRDDMHSFVATDIALAIFSVTSTGPIGVDITQCEISCTFNLSWENALQKKRITPVYSTISLNKGLRDEILSSSAGHHNVMVASFLSDAFFNEKQVTAHMNNIIGFKITNYDAILKHEVIFNPYTEYSEGNKCVYWGSLGNGTNGSWVIDGKLYDDSTCRFFRQGYFSVLKDGPLNITAALEAILLSNVSVSEKLTKAAGISLFYDRFKPVDLHILVLIVAEQLQIDGRGLDTIKRISENFFAISRSILIKSQMDYNVLKRFLASINNIAWNLSPNVPYTLNNKLSVLVCLANTSIGVAFDENLSCLRPEQSEVTYAAKLILSESLSQAIVDSTNGSTDAKFITTAFYDDDLFVQEKKVSASTIFGISIPFFNGSIDDGITVSFNMKESYDYNSICAYWKYSERNYGHWLAADSSYAFPYVSCGFGNVGYFSLVKKLTNNLTEILQNIQDSSDSFSKKLTDVVEVLVENRARIEPLHIFIISEIFKEDGVTSEENLMRIGNITSMVMDIDRTILEQSQKKYNATDWILYRVDTLIEQFKGNISLVFSNNLAVVILSDMIEITFKNVDDSWTMKVITSESLVEDPEDWDALLVIDGKLRTQMQQYSSSIYITVYFSDALFIEKHNDTTKNMGIIVGAKVAGVDDANLTENLQVLFRNIDNRTDICVYWNYISNGKCIEKTFQETNPVHENSMSLCGGRVDGTHLALLKVEKNITNELQDILNSTSPIDNQLQEVFSIVHKNCLYMCPYDVYLISQILAKVTVEKVVTRKQTILVSKIVSKLFHVQRSVLREAQLRLHATDKILQYLDEILARVSDEESSEPIIQDRFMITMYDLKKSSIFGFTLSHCTKTTCVITALTERISPTEIAAGESFNMALVLSEELRKQVDDNFDPVQLTTTTFFEDDFFIEKSQGTYNTSKICGVLLPGLREPLRGSISLIYNIGQYEVFDNQSCAFWNYLAEEDQLIGGSWKKDIGQQESGRTVICEFQHITHFVLLLANSDILDEENTHILDIITNINSVLSLLGLFGIILTAVLFDRWRNNTGNQILINFALAISIKNVMLYISVGVWGNDGKGLACTITGGILHYSILSEFCWMLIIAILQFKRFVEVLGGPLTCVLFKACICGWVFPALPVFLIIMIDVHNYSRGHLGLCYPSGFGLYLAVWLPLLVIIAINSIIFVLIIYNVFRNKSVLRDQTNHEMIFQWRLALVLFFMLGFTWLFGFLGLVSGISVFLGLFCCLASVQGFLMFSFFIVFNKSTRLLYIQGLRWWLYSKGYKKY